MLGITFAIISSSLQRRREIVRSIMLSGLHSQRNTISTTKQHVLSHTDDLEAAFQYFNETSEQLADSYSFLEHKVKQLSSQLHQVSAEKDAEHHEKHQLETRMKALLDFLPGGVVVIDARGRIVETNPAAKELLAVELDGKLWRHVIGECFAPKNDDGLEVSTKSGRRISISTSSMAEQGQIILLTDQTETRKLQKNLSRYEKLSAMGKMVSVLAHQIRTPLSAAMLYAGHLNNPCLDENKKTDFSKKILSRLQHMEKQVRDMMLFVKSELPLNDLITLRDLEIGLREACDVPLLTTESRCIWKNNVGNVFIKCHREALISALMNLVNNGLQSKIGPVELHISMNKIELNHQSHIVIRIRDNGAGMSADQLKKAQELFFTSKAQGTGLGLAVVHSVARAHGAKFRMTSVEGEGTDGLFIIPIAS